MLDVARHFFGVGQVERYIDEIAHYKINYLHLHLSDDQGWRIAINGWPDLTTRGGSTEVGGGAGGYYTQADYSAIVAYAASRYITVIPEIDMPGHTNAALASYARLNCEGQTPKPYTGIEVGFSSLCVPLDLTYAFIDHGDRPARRTDTGAIHPHRRRRVECDTGRRLRLVHRPRSANRPSARQDRHRLAQHRRREPTALDRRGVLGHGTDKRTAGGGRAARAPRSSCPRPTTPIST